MLSIRMKPVGKKHQPTYKVVVSEARSKLTGKFIEDLGWYNPHLKTSGLKDERIKYWLGVGAQASDTVYNLLVSKKVIEGEKIPVHKKKKVKEGEEKKETKAEVPAEGAAPAAPEKPAEEAAPSEEKPAEPAAPAPEEKKEEPAPTQPEPEKPSEEKPEEAEK